MASASNRPLSPHLQIWRWGPAMFTSILHRVTGNALALGGLGVLVWWLGALASGPAAYQSFTGWVWADLSALTWSGSAAFASLLRVLLKLALVGISWSFFSHMASGLRHFVLDIGAGYELTSNARWAMLTPLFGILLTAAFWAMLLLR